MRRSVATFVAACLVLAGCSSPVTGTPTAHEPAPSAEAPAEEANKESSQPSQPERPKDRDPAAVRAALRQIDACALVDVTMAKGKAQALPVGPHACALAVQDDYGYLEKLLTVSVGTEFDHGARIARAPVTVQGAKAYQAYHEDGCYLTIPVSFNYGVQLDHNAEEKPRSACKRLRSWAKYVVKKLSKPSSIKVSPGKRPLSAWDGCTLLAHVLDAPEKYVYSQDSAADPFSTCMSRVKEGVGETPKSGETVSIHIEYDQDTNITQLDTKRTVGGKKATMSKNGEECDLKWVQGPSKAGDRFYRDLLIKLSAPCSAVDDMAKKVMRQANKKPKSAKPLRKLTFSAKEPDTPALGACANFPNGATQECVPYQPTTAPKGYDAITAAMAQDPNVQCAVFESAVKAHFGDDFEPLNFRQSCYFVSPDHELEITTNVLPPAPMYVPREYSDLAGPGELEEIQLNGKPALSFRTEIGEYDIYLSHVGNVDAPGGLHIGLRPFPPRGWSVNDTPEISAGQVQQAQQVMKDVVKASLN